MPKPARPIIRSHLGHLDYHLPALKDHLEGKAGLKARVKSGEGDIRRSDAEVLDRVMGIPAELLPKNAYRQAERLQNRAAGMKTEKDRHEHLTELHAFLGNIIKEAEANRGHWLHILRTGQQPKQMDPAHGGPVYAAAMKRRKRLGQLMHRYVSSGLWARNTIPSPEIRVLWRQWVREGLIKPESRQAVLSRNERHGMDPNTLLSRLAERAGIHRDELDIMRKWSYTDLEKLVGKPLPGSGYT